VETIEQTMIMPKLLEVPRPLLLNQSVQPIFSFQNFRQGQLEINLKWSSK